MYLFLKIKPPEIRISIRIRALFEALLFDISIIHDLMSEKIHESTYLVLWVPKCIHTPVLKISENPQIFV